VIPLQALCGPEGG